MHDIGYGLLLLAMAAAGCGGQSSDPGPRPIVGTWDVTTIYGQPMAVSIREAMAATGSLDEESTTPVKATMTIQFQEAGGFRGYTTISAPMRQQVPLGTARFLVIVSVVWRGTWTATDARLTTAVTHAETDVTVIPSVIDALVRQPMQAIADVMTQGFIQTESGPYAVTGDVLTLPDGGAVFARRSDAEL